MVHKLFHLLKEDLSQQGLVMVAVWSIGEFGELLLADSPALDDETPPCPAQAPRAVVDLLERVLRDHNTRPNTKAYVLTTLMKLADRLRGAERGRLAELISTFQCSMALELQQRACEFLRLLEPAVDPLRAELLSRIPALDEATLKARRAGFAEENQKDGEGGGRDASPTRGQEAVNGALSGTGLSPVRPSAGGGPSGGGGGDLLLDLDDIFGAGTAPAAPPNTMGASPRPPPSAAGMGGGGDLLADIFSSSTTTPATPSVNALADMFGGPAMAMQQPPITPTPFPPQQQPSFDQTMLGLSGSGPFSTSGPLPVVPASSGGGSSITAFEKDGLLLTMDLAKPNPADPQASQLTCRFLYSGSAPLTGLVFQCAVPKYVRLEMSPASGTTVPANRQGSLEQVVRVTNSMLGQKPLQIKIKIQYSLNGQTVTEMGQVSNFPPGY